MYFFSRSTEKNNKAKEHEIVRKQAETSQDFAITYSPFIPTLETFVVRLAAFVYINDSENGDIYVHLIIRVQLNFEMYAGCLATNEGVDIQNDVLRMGNAFIESKLMMLESSVVSRTKYLNMNLALESFQNKC